MKISRSIGLAAATIGSFTLLNAWAAYGQRQTVLKQIALPHNYYFREMYLPQLTSGPSSVEWLA